MRSFVPLAVLVPVLLLPALLMTGCNRSLESVQVRVEADDAETLHAVKVSDLGRRSRDEESFVVPLPGSRSRPFRFRVESAGDHPVRLDHPEARLTVTLSGDTAGGELTLFSGDAGQRYPFSGNIRDHRETRGERYRLSFPLDRLREAPWEIEFSAAAGSAGYRVEEIRFGRDGVRMEIEDSPGFVHADALLPVTLTDTSLELPALRGVIRDHAQALLIEYHAGEELFRDRRDRPVTTVTISTEEGATRELEMRLRPGSRLLPVRPGYWLPGASSLTIEGRDGLSLKGIKPLPIPADPLEPVLIELEELQRWSRELWRREEFELFAWSAYPGILWMDHRDYGTQARMFTRLAFFVEKRGYQGRLLTDAQLENRHGWNAHNYRPEGLAAFFNTAHSTGFTLNREERELLEIVVARGLLVENVGDEAGTPWLPGSGGILSISQDSFPALRRLLTVHEAMHGVFYEEPAFRRTAFDYWDHVLTQREREFWQLFFSWMTYDPDDRYLMVNEFQAYLLQQGEANANWYFGTRTADRLRTAQPHRAESINLMLRDYPDTFIRAAAALNESLFQESGMVGGDPFCLRPLD
ncbi:MAG: hypothetical protein EA427_09670 [Spirochaetaceae bacterium]|nr:MAG: hypothetical protein EA427_09670 [Spirochaetaceae bacterium]